MFSLDLFSIFPLISNKKCIREFTLKDNKFRITLMGNGNHIDYAKIENLTTGKTPYDWHNIEKESVEMAFDDILNKI